MIKLLLKSCLILALITSLSKADQITTGNLLPNAGQGASSAQSVDNSIDKIGNSFNNFTSNNATNFSSEVEVTGTGTLSYNGTLLDITTGNDTTNQNKLDNGITLQSNTIIQNCEWASSSYACGNRGSGRDSYSTKIQILDSNDSLLSETNQIRNNDAGYGSTAFKYTDTLIFNNVGSNKFNWEWTGIDGQANPGNLGGPNLLGANLFMIYDNTEIEESITQELHSIAKNLTESVRMVIIEEEVIEIKAAPMITAAPVATTQTITTAKLPPPTPLPSAAPKAAPQPTATTTSAPPANTQPASPAPTNTNKPTQKLTQKTNTPTKTTSTTTATNNAPKSTSSSTTTANSKTTKASKANETKKTEEKKSNSSPTKTATTKKENNKEQKTVQSKSGETKTAEAKSQSGSVETKEAVSLDTKMAKVDTDIKDIGKNLEIKNVIKLQAMVNNEMINVYNVPFYKEKLLYTDQLNIFDKPIYQNVTLGSYILNDPIVKSKINIIRIKKQKQKLLNEIEVLKNG